MSSALKHFKSSFIFTFVGVGLGAALGGYYTGTAAGAAVTMFIVAVLGVLEVSLSFDNAVVNATVLKEMDAVWRHRFITWGIAIAVFGMRLVLPLAIVAGIAHIGPIEAVTMAATRPEEYAHILTSARIPVASFGGAFLAMVGLKHFIDAEKEVFWIAFIERPLGKLGRVEAVQLAIVMLMLYGVSTRLHEHEQLTFIVAGMFGLILYIAVDGLGALLNTASSATGAVARAGLGSFLYLEVLDASFSFDGVIGAFALSSNLLVIALGLGIGAMFVRSLTIMLVEEGTLTEYRYLEHGAFYAIFSLALIMFAKTFVEVPEVVTGLIGAGFIALAFWSSLRHNRVEAAQDVAASEGSPGAP